MNWTLIALLAIPGLMMGLLSVKGYTRGIEPYLWLVLSLFAALVVARSAGQRPFLHGLSVGLAWGLLNGIIAAALFSIYIRHNPEVTQSLQSGSTTRAPQMMFLLGAPLIGLATGAVLGLLCWGASYLVRAAPPLTPLR